MHALLVLFCLVPAPKESPPFPVGEWQVEWGTISQEMIFHPDGRYTSKEYGSGFWSTDRDGNIWFSERDDSAHYAMWIDPKTGSGTGWGHCQADGSYHSEVKVRLRKK